MVAKQIATACPAEDQDAEQEGSPGLTDFAEGEAPCGSIPG